MKMQVTNIIDNKIELNNNLYIEDDNYLKIIKIGDAVELVDNKITKLHCHNEVIETKETSKEKIVEQPEIYKLIKKLYFWGFITLIIYLGLILIIIASFILGIQKMRENRVILGGLFIIFGVLTLGIWPYIYIKLKPVSNIEVTKDRNFYIKMYNNYNIAYKFQIFGLIPLLLFTAWIGVIIASLIVFGQLVRDGRTKKGVIVFLLGYYTCGLLYLYIIKTERERLKKEWDLF